MLLQWPHDLDVSGFLKNHWQTRPLLFEQAFPQFNNPLSRDELAGLALDGDVSSRIILRESDTRWHSRYGPFTVQELEQLPSRDWTLLVSDVEKHLPDMRDWLTPFHFIPQWRIDDLMISYAPTGASVGAHTDNYDVFLLQAAGRRRWSIDTNPGADKTLLPHLDIGVLANFTPRETFDLAPGDMLYLPPGVPHHGVSLDNECMTWSIGFRAPTHREIVTDLAENIAASIPEDAFYSDPSILLHEHSGQVSPNAISRIREIWNTYVHPDNDTFEKLAGELLTRRNIYAPGHSTGDNYPTADTQSQQTEQPSMTNVPEESLPLYLASLLGETQFWERNSFARFAFVAQFDAAENGQNAGVLKRLRKRITGEPTVKNERRDKTTTELNESYEPEFSSSGADLAFDDGHTDTVQIAGKANVKNSGDTMANRQPVTTPLSTAGSNRFVSAKLFVDGRAYECSDELARLLTSSYHISTADLRKLLRSDSNSTSIDTRVIGQLIESSALLPLQISG